MTSVQVAQAVRASSVAELFWTDPDGAPDGCGVVALCWGERPVVAFTYADEARARAVAACPQVALTLTESRSTATSFTPLVALGRPRLVEDLDGSVFVEHLVTEELRRYPPARALADSAMLRREHWWYLPRLVVLVDVQATSALPARSSAREHVLVVAAGDGLHASVVLPGDDGGAGPQQSAVPLTPTDGRELPAGRAALVGQDASFPDLEQWASWCLRGTFDGTGLRLTAPPSAVGLPPTPSIWRRMRRQQALGRACRAGIARAERRR